MKNIRSWMSHHPFKVVLFTFLFTLIPAIMAVTNESMFYPGLIAFMVFVIVWAICLWRHGKNLAVVAIFITAFVVRAEEPKPAVPIAVGTVVICVGAYCVYKMVKVCQKKFPPKSETNSNDGFSASEDEYGGAYEYSSIGSCYEPPSVNAFPYEDLLQNPTTFTLNVLVREGSIKTSMTANNEEGTTQTWDQFVSEMVGHGLFLTGRSSWQPQFEINGVPCDPSMVPLEFDQQTGRVTQRKEGYYPLRRVIIERSPNLQDWYPLMVTDVSDGTGFKVVDTTREGQMFYRVQVTQP